MFPISINNQLFEFGFSVRWNEIPEHSQTIEFLTDPTIARHNNILKTYFCHRKYTACKNPLFWLPMTME
jgi:hypothetical protein